MDVNVNESVFISHLVRYKFVRPLVNKICHPLTSYFCSYLNYGALSYSILLTFNRIYANLLAMSLVSCIIADLYRYKLIYLDEHSGNDFRIVKF